MDKETILKMLQEKKTYLEQVKGELFAINGQIKVLEELLDKEGKEKTKKVG